MTTAVEAQKASLEYLWLDYEYHEAAIIRQDMGAHQSPIDPLTSMTALKHLRIAAVFLFSTDLNAVPKHPVHGHYGWNGSSKRHLTDFFPPSLESLRITHADDHFIHLLRALHHFLTKRAENLLPACTADRVLPRLRRITIEGAVRQNRLPWPRLAHIKAMIEGQGMECELVQSPRCGHQMELGPERR